MDLPIPVTQKAKLVTVANGQQSPTEIEVQFNPASLVYTVENSTKQAVARPRAEQWAAQFSGKLAMDLQFDTTDSGSDVRLTTSVIAGFMQGVANASRDQSGASYQAQPLLSFQWGAYEFIGAMESFKEVIDFFSAEGVPLRSLVSISLMQQDQITSPTSDSSNVFGSLAGGSVVPTAAGDSVTGLAARGGQPSAARQLGTDNSLDSLRFTSGAALQVSSGVQFNAAAGFASSSSAGVSLGIGAGSSAGLQLSSGAGGGALFGGQASAGVPASLGAFAGLESGRATTSSTARLNPLSMMSSTTGTDVSTGVNASFSVGGAATAAVGFSTDVGADFNFSDVLVFDGD
jgi:hypothetical protein